MICVILQKYFQLNFPIGALPPLSNYFLSQSTSQAGQASTIQSWAGQGGTRLRQAGEREGGHSKDNPTLLQRTWKNEDWWEEEGTVEKWDIRFALALSSPMKPSSESDVSRTTLLVSKLSIMFSPHSKYLRKKHFYKGLFNIIWSIHCQKMFPKILGVTSPQKNLWLGYLNPAQISLL